MNQRFRMIIFILLLLFSHSSMANEGKALPPKNVINCKVNENILSCHSIWTNAGSGKLVKQDWFINNKHVSSNFKMKKTLKNGTYEVKFISENSNGLKTTTLETHKVDLSFKSSANLELSNVKEKTLFNSNEEIEFLLKGGKFKGHKIENDKGLDKFVIKDLEIQVNDDQPPLDIVNQSSNSFSIRRIGLSGQNSLTIRAVDLEGKKIEKRFVIWTGSKSLVIENSEKKKLSINIYMKGIAKPILSKTTNQKNINLDNLPQTGLAVLIDTKNGEHSTQFVSHKIEKINVKLLPWYDKIPDENRNFLRGLEGWKVVSGKKSIVKKGGNHFSLSPAKNGIAHYIGTFSGNNKGQITNTKNYFEKLTSDSYVVVSFREKESGQRVVKIFNYEDFNNEGNFFYGDIYSEIPTTVSDSTIEIQVILYNPSP